MDKITIKNPGDEESQGIDGLVRKTIQVQSLADVSDGYHTFDELYDHRISLWIALCRTFKRTEDGIGIAKPGQFFVWRSKNHDDGTPAFGGGWFVLGMGKGKGTQMTYHLPLSRWEETNFADTLEKAPEFDGHTPADVLERLKGL